MIRRLIATSLLLLFPWLSCQADSATIDVVSPELSSELISALREGLSLYAMRQDPLLNEDLVQRQYQRGLEELAQSLQSLGYYQPDIQGQITKQGERWQIRYVIALGQPVTLHAVAVSIQGDGASHPDLIDWRARFPLKRGDVAHHGQYESAKAEAMRIAKAQGYFDAEFTEHSLLIDPPNRRATLTLTLNTGKRYRFGKITLHQDILDPHLLERYVPFAQGEEYDSRQLLQLQQALSDSDYYDSVAIKALPEQAADGEVPIEVELSPRKPARYSLSAGYGTDTGARAGLGYERRRINRYGHRFNMNYTVSELRSTLNTGYRIPLGDPNRDSLTLSSDWTEQSTSTAWYSNAIYGARLVRLIGDWQRSVGASLLREDYRVGNDVGKADLLVPMIALQRARPLPRESIELGWSLGLSVKGAMEGVLSDTSFTQAQANARLILPLGRADRLLFRVNGGTTWIDRFAELPVSQRFFTGGDYSVRGYAFNSLGPRDDSGKVIGGKNLLVGSAEFEHALTAKLAAAVFIDTGNAFDEGDYRLYTGIGLGARWRIPVGTIGIDVAQAQDLEGRPWKWHITVGSNL